MKKFLLLSMALLSCVSVCFGQTQVDRLHGRGASTFDQYSNTATVIITGATPSVAGGNVFKTNNAFTTTITNFLGGVDTQQIVIVCGEGNTTIQNNANIVITGGSDFSCVANTALSFVFNTATGVWSQNGGNGTGGGGGGSPAAPEGSLQRKTGGNFGASNVVESGTTLNVDDDTHHKGPNPGFDVTRYGAKLVSSTTSTTATCNGTTNVTLASAIDFANGDGIVLQQCGPATALSTPAAPSSVNQRAVANGATTRSYKVVAEDFNLGWTAASSATSSAVTAATLGAINTATVTSLTISGGISTYTTAANHNLAVGAQILFGTNGGVWQVLTTPSPTTFTIRVPGAVDQAATTVSASVNVASHIQVYWTGQANVMRYWVYRQDGGAGNFNLIGVAQGSEPFYDDYGWNAPSAPAYIPTTAPASAGNQSIATTIVSGAGTTSIVVANTASNSIGGVQALHDNTVAVQTAVTAASTIGGGKVYVPKAPVLNGSLVFNFPMIFNGGGRPVTIELAGPISTNQPIVPDRFMTFVGSEDNQQGLPGFSKNYYSLINGVAYPLFLLRGGAISSVNFDHLYVAAGVEQGWGILVDNTFGGGSSTDIYFSNNFFSTSVGSGIPVVIRGVGFNYGLDHNIYQNQNSLFYSQGGLRLMGSAIAVPTGIPGIGTVSDSTFLGVGIKADTDALNGASIANVGSPWTFSRIFTESLRTAAFDFRNISNVGNWFTWAVAGYLGADPVTNALDLDFTGSCCVQGFYLDKFSGGTGGARINAVNASGLTFAGSGIIDAVSLPQGYTSTPYTYANFGAGDSIKWRAYETDGGFRTKGNAPHFVELLPPTTLAGTPAAGGSIPTGTWQYRVTAVGWNGGESAPSNLTVPLVITGGNQTVNLTWVASGIGTQGYNLYRSNGGGFARVNNASPILVTSFSDTLASAGGGQNMPSMSGTGSSYMNATEVSAPIHRFPSAGGALFKVDVSASTLTANRGILWPDLPGTVALSNAAQTWSGAQTNMALTTPAITNGTASGLALTTPSIGGETITASPRAPLSTFLLGALTTTFTGQTFTLDKAITVTRLQSQLRVAPSGCSPNPIIRLSDGTSNVNLTLSAAANDSGIISQAYGAGAVLTIAVQTAALSCTTFPGDANVVVEFKMQ